MTSTLKPIVILQARYNSSRLPGKALKKINNIPVIILCAKRLANKGHKVIVATSKKKSDDRLIRVLEKNNIKYFRGKLNDVYSRYVNIIRTNNLKEDMLIVRATGDNILPDGNLINILTKKIKNNKIDYLRIDNRIHNLPKGFTLEIFKVSELLKLSKVQLSKRHLEHVTLKIYETKKKYKNILIKEIKQKKNLRHFRVTIDEKKDYIFMKNLFKKVKNPYKESSLKILNYLKKE